MSGTSTTRPAVYLKPTAAPTAAPAHAHHLSLPVSARRTEHSRHSATGSSAPTSVSARPGERHREEREAEHRGRHEAGPAVPERATDRVDAGDAREAEDGRQAARDLEDPRRVGPVGGDDVGRAAHPDRDGAVDEVQQVRVARGVLEVPRVGVAEGLDRPLGEVRALVDVVDVRQPVVVVHHAQHEADEEDEAEDAERWALLAQQALHREDASSRAPAAAPPPGAQAVGGAGRAGGGS